MTSQYTPACSGFIYVFRADGGFFKIGKSIDPKVRLQDFSSLPFNIAIEYQVAVGDMTLIEGTLHKMYREKWVKGEWFTLSPEDLLQIRVMIPILDEPDLLTPLVCREGKFQQLKKDLTKSERKVYHYAVREVPCTAKWAETPNFDSAKDWVAYRLAQMRGEVPS